MKIKNNLAFLFVIFIASTAWGQIEPIKDGDIHEAFLTHNYGTVVLPSSQFEPPLPIWEDLPPQIDSQAEWLHGYWSWFPERKTFIWITGVERKPPPGRFWTHGFWKYFPAGWTWIPGFWTDRPYITLTFIENPPPDPLSEDPGLPPSQDHFWAPGYWNYNAENQKYEWLRGKWELFDPDWVFIPAHYLWQPEGYVLVTPYWDWPLTRIGKAYEPVEITNKEDFYQPKDVIDIATLLKRFFFYYPDYLCYFQHHQYVDVGYWRLFLHTPPWWRWPSWWSFSWTDQWNLWWWYIHPGYPQPEWLTQKISNSLPPPSKPFLKEAAKIRPPYIITENGIVFPSRVIEAIKEVNQRGKEFTERLTPIFPSDPELFEEVRALFLPPPVQEKILLPTGSYASLKNTPPELLFEPLVNFGKRNSPFTKSAATIVIPTKPTMSAQIKVIKKNHVPDIHPLYRSIKLPKPPVSQPMEDFSPIIVPYKPSSDNQSILQPDQNSNSFTPFKNNQIFK